MKLALLTMFLALPCGCQSPVGPPPIDRTLYTATLTAALDLGIDSLRLIVMGDTIHLTAGQVSTCRHFNALHGTPLDFSLFYGLDSLGGSITWPTRTSPNIWAWAQVAGGDVPSVWIGWTRVRAPCDSVAG